MAISNHQKLSLTTQVVSSKEQPVLVDLVFTLGLASLRMLSIGLFGLGMEYNSLTKLVIVQSEIRDGFFPDRRHCWQCLHRVPELVLHGVVYADQVSLALRLFSRLDVPLPDHGLDIGLVLLDFEVRGRYGV